MADRDDIAEVQRSKKVGAFVQHLRRRNVSQATAREYSDAHWQMVADAVSAVRPTNYKSPSAESRRRIITALGTRQDVRRKRVAS